MITAKMKVHFNHTDRFERKVVKGVELGIHEVAEQLVGDIREHWSTQSPSSPGSPPAIRTGNLDQSIFIEKTGRDEKGRFQSKRNARVIFVKVDTTKGPKSGGREEYGTKLEDEMDREYLAPAAERVSGKLGVSIKRHV